MHLRHLGSRKKACNATTPDSLDCQQVLNKKYLCYAILDLCCQTCRNFSTNRQGCEFGDKQPNCVANKCLKDNKPDFKYQATCCGTCANVTSTTPSPVTGITTPSISTLPPGIKYCLKPGARYYRVSCRTIQSWLPNICTIDFLRASCCQLCQITTTVPPVTPKPGLCLNPNGTYYSLPCSSVNFNPAMCDDPVFNFQCCLNCSTLPSTNKCLKPIAKYSFSVCGFLLQLTGLPVIDFCSLNYLGSNCCEKCPVDPISKGCMDKSKNCGVLARVVPDVICNLDICCKSCHDIKTTIKYQEIISILKRMAKYGGRRRTSRRRYIEDK